jgi:hypothetical protein
LSNWPQPISLPPGAALKVALQRCPILRAGEGDFIRMDRNLPSEIKASLTV